jgi:hypothetical protein
MLPVFTVEAQVVTTRVNHTFVISVLIKCFKLMCIYVSRVRNSLYLSTPDKMTEILVLLLFSLLLYRSLRTVK